jgi:hypothetical protein
MGDCEKISVILGLYIKRHDIAVLAVAQPLQPALNFVDAGKHANLPDFAFGKGTTFQLSFSKLPPLLSLGMLFAEVNLIVSFLRMSQLRR